MSYGVKYWCCPDCGIVFVQTPTGKANTLHECPGHEGMSVVPPPWEALKELENLKKLKSGDVIKCPDDNCCGCLIEGETKGDIRCNECGTLYEIKER